MTKITMLFYRLYCRIFQQVYKLGMYFIPWKTPKIIDGTDALKKTVELISELGIQRPLVVTSKGTLNRGTLEKFFNYLNENNINHFVFSDVEVNPTDRDAMNGLAMFNENNCDAIVAVGGGSYIDCAKAIGALHVKKGKSIRQLQGVLKVRRRLPVFFAVPTTSGSGSEATIAAVITDSTTHHKASINDISLMPTYAVLDPTLTTMLPPHLTAITGLDALTHAVEAYTNGTYNTFIENDMAKKAIKLIFDNLCNAFNDGSNLEYRRNMQLAAFYAGRAFTRGCVGYVHAIGHTLGGLYNIPHGLAMSTLLPIVMRHYDSAAHKKLAELAEVCGLCGEDDACKAEAFLKWVEETQKFLNLPDKLNVPFANDMDTIIKWAKQEANPLYPVPVIWTDNDFKTVIENALEN